MLCYNYSQQTHELRRHETLVPNGEFQPLVHRLRPAPDPEARAWAIVTLKGLGPDAQGAVPALMELLSDPELDRYALEPQIRMALDKILPDGEQPLPPGAFE